MNSFQRNELDRQLTNYDAGLEEGVECPGLCNSGTIYPDERCETCGWCYPEPPEPDPDRERDYDD